MVEIRGESPPEEMAEVLFQRAVALWGQERAAVLRSFLAQTAEHLWMLSRNTPGEEEEPGFFM